MKNVANDLLLKILKTPAVAEQVRKNLVNRDVSITIDGKEYQILSKKASEDEVDKLKVRVYDLRRQLFSLVMTVTKYMHNEIDVDELDKANTEANYYLNHEC